MVMAVTRHAAARGDERTMVAAYVLDRLEAECSAERGVATTIAKAIGFSTAAITNVRKKERGVGDELARALGRYWGFATYGDMEAEALRWAREHPDRISGDAYPNRTEAARLCRAHGVPEAAIAKVMVEPVAEGDAGRSVLWWADRMRLAQMQMLDGH